VAETLVAVTPPENAIDKAAGAAIEVPVGREVDELEVVRDLVRQARDAGVALTGPDGLPQAGLGWTPLRAGLTAPVFAVARCRRGFHAGAGDRAVARSTCWFPSFCGSTAR
jgi:hypothetical protein